MSTSDMDSIDRDAMLIGIDPKTWQEYKKNLVRPYLEGVLEADARTREGSIGNDQRQKHLAKWGLRFEKSASLCKDPVSRKRMMEMSRKCLDMMENQR